MLKSAHFAFALSLLFLAFDAGAAPHGSFSHGFSSHASSSHASIPHAAPAPARAPSGGFGSFGRGAAQAQPQQSNSALSQQLSKNASQARAMQTLDQRNADKAAAKAAQNAPQPAPGYAQPAPAQPANAPAPGPTTVIVHQDSGGLGHVVAGAMIARSMNAHAHPGYYPAPGYNGAPATTPTSSGGSFVGAFVMLCLLAVMAWGLWLAWRGIRRRRAALREANKPNYSFERN
jgi:hypothetical protein